LVIWHIGAGARGVGLLCLPGNQSVLDVDLPRARAGAVGAVRRAHDLVVLPALPGGVLPSPVLVGDHTQAVREPVHVLPEEHEAVEKLAHPRSLLLHAPWAPGSAQPAGDCIKAHCVSVISRLTGKPALSARGRPAPRRPAVRLGGCTTTR